MRFCRDVSALEEEEENSNTAYLGTVVDTKQKSWTADLTIKGKQVSFRLDTGAEVCTGMVIVPKKNGKVHICVDFKPLNRSGLESTKFGLS